MTDPAILKRASEHFIATIVKFSDPALAQPLEKIITPDLLCLARAVVSRSSDPHIDKLRKVLMDIWHEKELDMDKVIPVGIGHLRGIISFIDTMTVEEKTILSQELVSVIGYLCYAIFDPPK